MQPGGQGHHGGQGAAQDKDHRRAEAVGGPAGEAKAERLVYLKLMEKYQNTDPFKYILYSAKIGEQTPAMAAGK